MSEAAGPGAQEPRRPPPSRPEPRRGSALASATSALVRVTSKMMGQVRDRSGSAYADFQARPEHSRWRAYALGSYGLILAATFAAQLWTDNKFDAYVRVQRVDLPALTQIFVRNDSSGPWRDVRLNLNGIYTYDASEVRPGDHLLVKVNQFCIGGGGRNATCAPKNIVPESLAIDCDRGHYDADLRNR